MENDILKKLNELDRKIDDIYVLVEKTHKTLTWRLIITIVFIVLPIIGLIFAIPTFLTDYMASLQSLGL